MKEINVKELMGIRRKIEQESHDIQTYGGLRGFEKSVAEHKAAKESLVAEFREKSVKLESAIKEAEGKANVRCINVEGVIDTLLEVEDKLGISKKALNGVKVHVDIHGQSFPSAYKFTPMSTQFEAVMKNGAWRITEISRRRCGAGTVGIFHTEESENALIAKYTRW